MVARLAGVTGVACVERAGGRYRVRIEEHTEPAAAMRDLISAVPPARIELHRPTLEDIFVDIVNAAGAPAATGALGESPRDPSAEAAT